MYETIGELNKCRTSAPESNFGWIGAVAALICAAKTASCVEMSCICCIKKFVYPIVLVLILGSKSDFADNARIAHSLEYVTFSHSHDTLHLLNRL